MNKAAIRREIEIVFSDSHMFVLAIAALVIFMLELFNVSQITFGLLVAGGWVIWFMFLAEFALRLYVENDKVAYLRKHRFDSFLSFVIIFTPIVALLINVAFYDSALFRLIKISSVISNSTLISAGAYASKAGVKTNQEQEREQK